MNFPLNMIFHLSVEKPAAAAALKDPSRFVVQLLLKSQ